MRPTLSDHRVEAKPAGRRVQVVVDGEVVAESADVIALEETRIRTRWYLPLADVRDGVLRPSEHRTFCPWKGMAAYYDVVTASGVHRDLVWYYPEPLPAVEAIRGRVAFYDERVELRVE